MGFANTIVTAAVVGASLFAQSTEAACYMQLDDKCPAKVWQDQYRCIMNQNSLKTIMDCVVIRPDRTDVSWCRPADSILDPGESNTELYTRVVQKGVAKLCVNARSVLIYGPPTWPSGGVNLSKAGALKMCPVEDPNFLTCLCEWNITANELLKFAVNFKADSTQVFGCGIGGVKRDSIPEEVLALPSFANSTTENTNSISRRDIEFSYVNIYGRPVYSNGYVGYPLPYYDQLFNYYGRPAAKRCYAHPEEAYVAACTSWYLPTSTAYGIATTPPRYATYARAYTSSVTPSAAAPSSTDIESLQGQVTAPVSGSLTSSGLAGPTGTVNTVATTTTGAPASTSSPASTGSQLVARPLEAISGSVALALLLGVAAL